MNNERRTLAFASLFEVMSEVDRLLAGYRKVGNWSLGQVCNHLAGGLILSMDGFPSRAPLLLRKTIGPIIKKRVFRSGKLPNGGKLAEEYAPKPNLDDRAEAEALRGAILAFGRHSGPMADHPFFGPLTHQEWDRFHSIHSAHHLSFVHPDDKFVG